MANDFVKIRDAIPEDAHVLCAAEIQISNSPGFDQKAKMKNIEKGIPSETKRQLHRLI